MKETHSSDRQSVGNETSRRSYLLGAGSLIGSLALLNAGSAAASGDDGYEEIVVPSGQTHTIRLGSGDTLENVLLDVSASGARYDISASGSNWAIRNVGIRGHLEDTGRNEDPFRVRVTDSNGTGVIENVCFEVTTRTRRSSGEHHGETGIYVWPNHVGTLEMDRIYMQNFPDNGFYASEPGNSSAHPTPGHGGEVHISNSYVKDCNTSAYRLGSTGSYLDNCVAVGGRHRGLWAAYEETDVYDSDLGSNGSDVAVGDSAWSKADRARVSLTGSRWETEAAHGGNTRSNINGSSVGSPRDRVPAGCPTSAEAAANGGSASEEPEPEPELPEDAHLVAFVTEPDAELAEYELAVDGELVPTEAHYESPSGGRIAAHRETVEEEDGLSTVASLSGGGHGDAYEVHGPVRDVTVDQPDAMWIELDGERVSEGELIERTGGDEDEDDGPSTLEVAGQFEYRIEVSGEIQPAEAHARWLQEGDAYGDGWAEWWLSGSDEARTVWEFTGEITTLEIDDHDGETEIRTLAIDGEELDHSEYVEEDDGPHRLEVAGQFEYRVDVSGEIRPTDAHAQWLSEGDAYGDDWAEWWLSGSDEARTVWEFTGDITNLQIDDYDGETEIRTLAVDGEELDRP
ncbi:hypothetical protein [Halovivax gelatinilyticus]|uniref:hypothetical protein n=1 Tax=Halovivax gelatinilyticus TaxID=2961597 RepID=UPI0020CA8D06|nr:hypothetical protein [Halovivax gelatinilyticus]